MALKTNFPTINSWTTQSSLWGGVWVVIAISSINGGRDNMYTAQITFAND